MSLLSSLQRPNKLSLKNISLVLMRFNVIITDILKAHNVYSTIENDRHRLQNVIRQLHVVIVVAIIGVAIALSNVCQLLKSTSNNAKWVSTACMSRPFVWIQCIVPSCLLVPFFINNVSVQFCFDSGVEVNIIDKETYDRINMSKLTLSLVQDILYDGLTS